MTMGNPSYMSRKARLVTSKQYLDDMTKVEIVATEGLDEVGEFAAVLLKQMAGSVGVPNKRDVVSAFDVSEEFYQIARERGHVMKLPDITESDEAKSKGVIEK
jgi:hypothetical protein